MSVVCRTEKGRRNAMIVGVAVDLCGLGYFKYANFFVDNVNGILTFAGGDGISLADVLLPIGISFHTFQSISYIVDVWRRDAPPARRLVDFLAFGALFPQLIAGPVLRYKDLSEQFVQRTHTLELFTSGVYRFIQGLAMKVLIADSISPLADRIFALENPTFLDAWVGALAYTFQLFFDFAGYSAMAIGLGLMIGFKFIENFNSPYISRSITEFWRRWHISLSTWFRDYLYIPLGGNRRGKARTYVNLVATMVLGGFWHGANWTFILWGFWHGGLMALERRLGAKNRETIWPTYAALPITFLLVVLGWVMFRSISVNSALAMYTGMVGINGWGFSPDIAWQMRYSELVCMSIAAIIAFSPILIDFRSLKLSGPVRLLVFVSLGLLAVSKMASQTYSPFLYFQF